jgi:hypothetical protein
MAWEHWRRTSSAAVAVLGLLVGRTASAVEPTDSPRFVLDYAAPGACPGREVFLDALHTRTPRPQLVESGDTSAIAIAVRIEATPSSASGQLQLREPDGTAESRNVTSATCAEVVSALALVAAVMLDPDALSGPVAPVEPSPPPPAPVVPPPGPRPPPSPPPALSPPSKPTWEISGGAEVGALGGIGPAIAPMGGGFFDVERRVAPFASSARLGVDVARTESDLRRGSHVYEWVAAVARLCPVHVPVPRLPRLRVAPCGELQIGGHRGTTTDVPKPSSSVQLWVAPGVEGLLEWALSSAVSLEIHGGALFPLRRSRFFLAPNSTIFEVPGLSATAAVGLRVRFL